MQVHKILLPLNVSEPFDYISDLALERGDFVIVPFRGGSKMGVVWGQGENEVDDIKIKTIEEKLELPKLPEDLMKFVKWVADYNITPIGNVLKMCISIKFGGKRHVLDTQKREFALTDLTKDQHIASENLRNRVLENKFSCTLIDGVTGSGKTEVYFEAIDEALRAEKQVLVMLPEIALSVQWLERFKKRFGIEPSIWHSDRTPRQRRETWLDVIENKAKLIVGARSALFLPFQDLGLIVVDEEHDQSYKQEEGVTYHGRDMAVVRASIEKAPIVLVSATPSVETVNNVAEGKYEKLELPKRFGGATLPKIKVIDMRLEKLPGDEFISLTLRGELTKAVENNQQSILFLNRRGFAPLTLCRACGHRVECPNCTSWLVTHSKKNIMQCHHCGFSQGVITKCPSCDVEEKLHPCGPGVERIFEEAKKYYPDSKVEIVASDSPNSVDDVIRRMENHEIDILIGTQMIAKGHHFPKLALVGIIDADLGLEGGDLRAMERTYQLMHQVAGRAGRESDVGKVFIQSYMPDNSAIQALIQGERDKFIDNEIASRKRYEMPPFGRMATITISGKFEHKVKEEIGKLTYKAPKSAGVEVLGPAPAPMSFLRGQHRYRLLVRTKRNLNIQKYISEWLSHYKLPSTLKMKIDIDPYSFV